MQKFDQSYKKSPNFTSQLIITMIIHDIAITLLDQVGSKTACQLVEMFGSAETALRTPYADLVARKVSPSLARTLRECSVWQRAEQIVDICNRSGIRILVRGSVEYPALLAECPDAPHILYVHGQTDFNTGKWISIVGTRKATAEGVGATERLVGDMCRSYKDTVVVSGLAFGIDKTAHLAAMDCGVPTVAVMAGWVEDIAPPSHHYIARRIIASGGAVVSDMPPGTIIRPANFISRNRIIAGLSHVTVVAESGKKGGSLITADIASSYDRALFAIPGRSADESFAGTNALIKTNKAIMYQDISDIATEMAWPRSEVHRRTQGAECGDLPPYLTNVFTVMDSGELYTLDMICEKTDLTLAEASSALIGLELRGVIKTLQGGLYQKSRY